jgi:hypothetical protein
LQRFSPRRDARFPPPSRRLSSLAINPPFFRVVVFIRLRAHRRLSRFFRRGTKPVYFRSDKKKTTVRRNRRLSPTRRRTVASITRLAFFPNADSRRRSKKRSTRSINRRGA